MQGAFSSKRKRRTPGWESTEYTDRTELQKDPMKYHYSVLELLSIDILIKAKPLISLVIQLLKKGKKKSEWRWFSVKRFLDANSDNCATRLFLNLEILDHQRYTMKLRWRINLNQNTSMAWQLLK